MKFGSGNETKGASKVTLINEIQKPEETCKQGCLLKTRNTGANPYSSSISVLSSFTFTTYPKTQELQLYIPSKGQLRSKYFAHGHKYHDQPGQGSNPLSMTDKILTQRTRPFGYEDFNLVAVF